MLAFAAADPVTKLTRFDAALPFAVAVLLVLVGAAVGDFVTDKVSSVLTDWATRTGQDLTELTAAFQPETIAEMSGWTIDTAQVVTTVLAPLVGLVLLFHQGATGALVLANLAMFVVALFAFRHFWKKPPDHYGVGWFWIFTPLTVLALVLNIAGGAIAYAIGP